MVQIIVDPDEQRKFASFLHQLVAQLKERSRALQSTKGALGEVWKDANFNEFEKSFDATIIKLDRFFFEADSYCAYLRKKADLGDRYLRR